MKNYLAALALCLITAFALASQQPAPTAVPSPAVTPAPEASAEEQAAFEQEMMMYADLFETNYLETNLPVFVFFTAPGCPYCDQQKKVLPVISKKFDGKIKLHEIDLQANPQYRRLFAINSWPTLIVFYKKALILKNTGYLAEDELTLVVDQTLQVLEKYFGKSK